MSSCKIRHFLMKAASVTDIAAVSLNGVSQSLKYVFH